MPTIQPFSGPMPLIGIVTVLYGSEEVLPDFFTSLAKQKTEAFGFKLYVIDNSPTANGSEICKVLAAQHGIDTNIVFNNANLGVAAGNNKGIALARDDHCSHILLSNNDVVFEGGTIARLFADLVASQASAITPKMYYYGTDGLIWYAGGRFDLWTMRTPHIGIRERDRGQFDVAGDTEYAPTCFMLLHANVFEKIGFMDEAYFVYYDDSDFVLRMRQAGLRLRYAPECVVQHKVSTSTGGDESLFSIYYSNRNRIYFLRKHLTGLRKAWAMTYIAFTKLLRYPAMPADKAAKLRAGIRDGLRMPISGA